MWRHIEPADIERAKERLGQRLSETLSRHAEEITVLQAKQTQEIYLLETKQTEITSLEALIERFAGEFQQKETTTSESSVDQDGIDAELDGSGATYDNALTEAGSAETLPKGTGALNVAYASPNFRPFRKLAS